MTVNNQKNLSIKYSKNYKYSEKEIFDYIQLMINKSMFSNAIEYINDIKLPPISFSTEFHLNVMEQFIKLLIYQGYYKKAESVIIKIKNRVFDLELVDLYVKLNIWDSIIKKNLKKSYASVPLFESLDIFFDDIEDEIIKAMVYLQASHLPEFIASQENFLKESYKIISKAPKSANQPYTELAVMNSLGVFNGLIGNLSTCKSILEKTIQKSNAIGDIRRESGSMTNLAYLYLLDPTMTPESHLMGRSMLQESLHLSEKVGALEFQSISNLHLAEYYKHRGKANLGMPYYNKVYDLQQKRGVIDKNEKLDEILGINQIEDTTDSVQELPKPTEI